MHAQAQPLVTGDLTIYYDFDSFTDTVMDKSGNNFHGKVQDATRNMLDGNSGRTELLTTGIITNDTSNPKRGAGAIRFTQTEVPGEDPVFVDMDGSIISTNFPAKVPTTAITVAAWVNLTDITADRSILQGSSTGHGNPHFQIQGTTGAIRVSQRAEGGSPTIFRSDEPGFAHPYPNQPDIDANGAEPIPFPINEWHHVAYTYDAAADGGLGDFDMYYDGVNIRSLPTEAPGDMAPWGLRVSGDYFDGLGIGTVYDNATSRLTKGLLDELYVFTRALSPAEIQTLVNIPPPGVNGDYNNNGTVDAADYVAWRDASPTATLPNDSTPGTVNQADFDVWRTNFGRPTIGSGAGNAAVPEPATVAILLVACVFGLACQRRR
jgi:hypothetical protein